MTRTNDFPTLGLGLTSTQIISQIGGTPLDPGDAWDSVVIAEADLLTNWSGLKPSVVHVANGGTAAYAGNVIAVDRAQLDGIFGSLSTTHYSTAIFIALAHEFGHLLQYHYFGVAWVMDPSRRLLIEAHADFLGGTWIGKRIGDGIDHSPDGALHTGLALKSGTADYPTDFQRACLMMEGLAAAAGVQLLEAQMPADASYIPFTEQFAKQDIEGTFRTVVSRLPEMPSIAPPPPSSYQGPATR